MSRIIAIARLNLVDLVRDRGCRLFYYVNGQEALFANAIDQATTFIQGTGHQMELEACLDGSSGYSLTIYVGTGGTVQSTGATPPDADHQDVADCLAAAAATWVFEDPGPGGAKVTLDF